MIVILSLVLKSKKPATDLRRWIEQLLCTQHLGRKMTLRIPRLVVCVKVAFALSGAREAPAGWAVPLVPRRRSKEMSSRSRSPYTLGMPLFTCLP